MSVDDRLAELEARLARTRDPIEAERLEVMIAELAAELDDPEPTRAQLNEWALIGEDRMLSQMGWGRDDC